MSKAFDGRIIDIMTLPTLTLAGGQTYYFAFRAQNPISEDSRKESHNMEYTIFVQEYHIIPLRIQLIFYADDHTSLGGNTPISCLQLNLYLTDYSSAHKAFRILARFKRDLHSSL